MSEEIRFGQIRRDKRGRIGAGVHITLAGEHGWSGNYRVSTHGLDPDGIVAEIERVRQHHEKKAARLTGLAAVQGAEMEMVSGGTLIVTDLSIHELSPAGGSVVLYVNVRRLIERKSAERRTDRTAPVEGFPWREVYKSVDAIPSEASIMARIIEAINGIADEAAIAEQNINAAWAVLQP